MDRLFIFKNIYEHDYYLILLNFKDLSYAQYQINVFTYFELLIHSFFIFFRTDQISSSLQKFENANKHLITIKDNSIQNKVKAKNGTMYPSNASDPEIDRLVQALITPGAYAFDRRGNPV